MKIQIKIKYKNHTNSFYYPDYSCTTEDGGMKMLIQDLKRAREPYELEISYC